MALIPEAKEPASHARRVRIEVALLGESVSHEVMTEVFRRRIEVNLRSDEFRWRMDVVRMTMDRESARDVIRDTLSLMDPEDQWSVILPIAEDLERRGIFRPR